MITLTTEQAQQIEEALKYARNVCVGSNWSTDDTDEALSTIREARAQEQAEQEPVAQQDSDDKRLLREIFMLCEATEELESTNDFMRGRIFEAKCIRRGIGTWYQDTFCGRSYMGEPVLNAAPVRTKDLTGDELSDLAFDYEPCENPFKFARAVIAAFKAKNAPAQRERQEPDCSSSGDSEPVAWALMHKNGLEFNTGYGMVKTLQEAEDMQRRHLGDVKIVPLYTPPPAIEAAIEATKEKAAKVCDGYAANSSHPMNFAENCAAAIRSMK